MLTPQNRDVGSMTHLVGGGWHDTSRAFFLKKKGAFSKSRKDISLFTAKSWGHVPPVPPPVPTSMPQNKGQKN